MALFVTHSSCCNLLNKSFGVCNVRAMCYKIMVRCAFSFAVFVLWELYRNSIQYAVLGVHVVVLYRRNIHEKSKYREYCGHVVQNFVSILMPKKKKQKKTDCPFSWLVGEFFSQLHE